MQCPLARVGSSHKRPEHAADTGQEARSPGRASDDDHGALARVARRPLPDARAEGAPQVVAVDGVCFRYCALASFSCCRLRYSGSAKPEPEGLRPDEAGLCPASPNELAALLSATMLHKGGQVHAAPPIAQ